MRKCIAVITIALSILACTISAPADTTPPPVNLSPTLTQSATALPASPSAPEAASPTTPPDPNADFGLIARTHVVLLTDIGGRVSGSPNEQAAAEYIHEIFSNLGYVPQTQKFSAWDEDGVEYTSANVIAVKQGDSPKEIIVGAHYDSSNAGRGADDNASGVGVMLEVAERIAAVQTPYTIRFIAFGSEENDLDGSYFYAELMKPADVQNTIAYVNLDSLAAGDITYVYSEEGEHAFLRDWLLDWAGQNSIPLQTVFGEDFSDKEGYLSDYGPFMDRGIPWIYFEATNWNLGDGDGYTQVDPQYGDEGYIWHTQYDNLAYLDSTFPGRVNEHLRIFVSALYAVVTQYQ